VVPELPPEELPLPVRLPEPLLLDAPLAEGELLAPSFDPPDEPHATPHATIRARPPVYLAIRSERRSIGLILSGRPHRHARTMARFDPNVARNSYFAKRVRRCVVAVERNILS
jgi:hypothetical protein